MRRLLVGSLVARSPSLCSASFSGAARARGLELQRAERCSVRRRSTRSATTASTRATTSRRCCSTRTAPGSGNSNLYQLQLPTDPKVLPNQAGTAGTLNFQLHPAFWFGMALCDNQSAPEFTHARARPTATPTSSTARTRRRPTTSGSTRARRSWSCSSTRPAGRPGRRGVSCDATQWCAAMAIFSLLQDQNTGQPEQQRLPSAGRRRAGELRLHHEERRAARVRRHRSARPTATFTPNSATDLFMSSGDKLTVDIHDGAAGLTAIVHDLTTGQTGLDDRERGERLRAGQLRAGCGDLQPVAVHVPADVLDLERAHARAVGGAQLQRRVLRRDRPLRVLHGRSPAKAATASANNEGTLDDDDYGLLQRGVLDVRPDRRAASPPTTTSTAPRTSGSGPARIRTAVRTPSTTRPRSRSRARSSTATQNYSRVAFETDLPRIEAPDSAASATASRARTA